MKSKSFNERLDELARPGMTRIMAVACGFWVSQLMAMYLFSGFLMSGRPSLLGPLSVAVFGFFFIPHVFRPGSKLAATLGLCSLGIVAGFIEYMESPMFTPRMASPDPFMLLAVALAFAGLILDMANCWQLALKAGGHRPLKLTGAPTLRSQTASQRPNFDTIIL